MVGDECGPVSVSSISFNLPGLTVGVPSGERASISYGVNALIHSRDAVRVPDGNCIKKAVIDKKSRSLLFLMRKEDCGGPIHLGRLNDVVLENPVDFGILDGPCF